MGDWVSMNNRAVDYRLAGRHRLAFAWWSRAAAAGDGSPWLEIGYALQHGIGVRRDLQRAARAYRRAIRAYYISEYEQEEAQYHLATLLLERRTSRARAQAGPLLAEASADGDYPQAARLLCALATDPAPPICHCRRALRRPPRWTFCPRHARSA
jgi:TPR repeat protein